MKFSRCYSSSLADFLCYTEFQNSKKGLILSYFSLLKWQSGMLNLFEPFKQLAILNLLAIFYCSTNLAFGGKFISSYDSHYEKISLQLIMTRQKFTPPPKQLFKKANCFDVNILNSCFAVFCSKHYYRFK